MSKVIASLDRGLRILEMLAATAEPLGLTEAARELDVDKSTAYRLLTTLQGREFVEQLDTKKYRLGLKCIELGYVAQEALDVRQHARPVLEELAADIGQTIHLAVLSGDEASYVDRVYGNSVITIMTTMGKRAPAHCTATGKAIFAHLPPERLSALYPDGRLEKCTEKTITDLEQLHAHLKLVKEQGYAVDDEERYAGVCCLAVPIFDHSRQVAGAIGVSGPSSQMCPERIAELKGIVMQSGARVSEALGYTSQRGTQL